MKTKRNTIYTFRVLPNNTFMVNDQEVTKETLLAEYDLYYGNLVGTEWFVETMKDVLDWTKIPTYHIFRLSFILKMEDYVRWTTVCIQRDDVPEEIIRKHLDTIDLRYVSNDISTDFIREFVDKLTWSTLLRRRKFTERELAEFRPYYVDDHACWMYIAANQNLTDAFVIDNYDKLKYYDIEKSVRLSEETVKKYKDNFDLGMLFHYNEYSDEFVSQFLNPKQIADNAYRFKGYREYC